ncbi:MAG: hypothetical protein ACTHMM_11895 [Agriterribacter sp.]
MLEIEVLGGQRALFIAEFKRLKADVTAEDKKLAVKEMTMSAGTVCHYLNGKVRDNDTAAALIAFFKKRIEQRNQVLA